MSGTRKRLGDVLIEAGVIYPKQLEKALEIQASAAAGPAKAPRKRLGRILMELGCLNERQIAQALAVQLGLPIVESLEKPIDEEVLGLVPREVAEQEILIPYQIQGTKRLVVAMADPLAWAAIDDLRFRTGRKISPILATESEILSAIERNYKIEDATADLMKLGSEFSDVQFLTEEETEEEESSVHSLQALSQAPPIIRLVTMTIMDGISRHASDVHIEPQENHLQVRYRIDGELRDIFRLPKRVQASVVSRVKIIASMDITNRTTPQDGGTKLRRGNREYDLRISTLPAVFGEKVVIRILDRSTGLVPLANLGVAPEIVSRLQAAAGRSQGMIVVTGPTGSGKTTTLYALLQSIRDPTPNIVTIEDPVEDKIDGITQVAIKEKAGLGFPTFLRSALRQDPNVMLVGEIRDRETAEMAIRAALTGHLVLTSLHTNDSVSTIYRLFDLGIAPYVISTSLSVVVAQRLVRKICPACKTQTAVPPDTLPTAVQPLPSYYQGAGCAECLYTGYQGQVGVYEYLEVTPRLKHLIADRVSEAELRQEAEKAGLVSLFANAWQKAAEGITTVSEVLGRVPLFAAEADGLGLVTPLRAAPPPPAAKLRTILVVNPEPAELERLRGVVDSKAYGLLEVPPGMEPYEAVCRLNPDLVLVDVCAPGAGAVPFLQRLKGNLVTATVPVVVAADAAAESVGAACLQAGASELLRKPLNAAVVSACLQKLLEPSE